MNQWTSTITNSLSSAGHQRGKIQSQRYILMSSDHTRERRVTSHSKGSGHARVIRNGKGKGLTPGLPTAEEEVGGAGGDGGDGDRDGHRGLQPLPLQELHAPAPFPSRGFAVGLALDSRAGFGLVRWCLRFQSRRD